jgi:hypothetical protein
LGRGPKSPNGAVPAAYERGAIRYSPAISVMSRARGLHCHGPAQPVYSGLLFTGVERANLPLPWFDSGAFFSTFSPASHAQPKPPDRFLSQ